MPLQLTARTASLWMLAVLMYSLSGLSLIHPAAAEYRFHDRSSSPAEARQQQQQHLPVCMGQSSWMAAEVAVAGQHAPLLDSDSGCWAMMMVAAGLECAKSCPTCACLTVSRVAIQ